MVPPKSCSFARSRCFLAATASSSAGRRCPALPKDLVRPPGRSISNCTRFRICVKPFPAASKAANKPSGSPCRLGPIGPQARGGLEAPWAGAVVAQQPRRSNHVCAARVRGCFRCACPRQARCATHRTRRGSFLWRLLPASLLQQASRRDPQAPWQAGDAAARPHTRAWRLADAADGVAGAAGLRRAATRAAGGAWAGGAPGLRARPDRGTPQVETNSKKILSPGTARSCAAAPLRQSTPLRAQNSPPDPYMGGPCFAGDPGNPARPGPDGVLPPVERRTAQPDDAKPVEWDAKKAPPRRGGGNGYDEKQRAQQHAADENR